MPANATAPGKAIFLPMLTGKVPGQTAFKAVDRAKEGDKLGVTAQYP